MNVTLKEPWATGFDTDGPQSFHVVADGQSYRVYRNGNVRIKVCIRGRLPFWRFLPRDAVKRAVLHRHCYGG